VKKTIAAGALVISLFVVGCGGDKATPVPATDAPAAVESMAAEAVESMAAEVEDAVESMAAEASPAA
jgi:PBP1b-binding outer membrane lipoprotein LpoB